MRILVLMLQSIRRDSNHGGSSKAVKSMCGMLATHGHEVTLLCSAATDNSRPYELERNVRVRPELPFRESWQDTWLVPPADIARIIATAMDASRDAERIVIFDSHFLYPDVLPAKVPTIWSLRDLVYVQAIQGVMGFRRDCLVTASDYIRQALVDATQGWLPGIQDRVLTVKNGINLDTFRRRDAERVRHELGLGASPVILLPHRPEHAKGFGIALELCRRLVDGGYADLRLVVPRGTDYTLMPSVRDFYGALERRVRDVGNASNLVLCDWLPSERMPELYSAATVTLCLGDIVESSSNVALESLACGTPVVAADVACFREFPDAVVTVPVGDVDAAERAVRAAWSYARTWSIEDVREQLRTHHDQRATLAAFRTVIEDATVRRPLQPRRPDRSRARIPIWISSQSSSLYDEYRKVHIEDATLERLWDAYGYGEFDVHAVLQPREAARLATSGSLVFTR